VINRICLIIDVVSDSVGVGVGVDVNICSSNGCC
jgi:hypothetical protein